MLPEGLNFQFTMNFGQVLQVVSVLGPFLIWLYKYGTAHTILRMRVEQNTADVEEMKADIKEMKGVLYGLPSMMVSLHRTPKTFDNGERGHSMWDKALAVPEDLPEEMKRMFETLRSIAEKGK